MRWWLGGILWLRGNILGSWALRWCWILLWWRAHRRLVRLMLHRGHWGKSSLRWALVIHLLLWNLLVKLLLLDFLLLLEWLLRSGLLLELLLLAVLDLTVLELFHVDCLRRGIVDAMTMNTDGDHDE